MVFFTAILIFSFLKVTLPLSSGVFCVLIYLVDKIVLVTIIQWMFDFGICLGVSQKIYHYVCYCKKENDISFFQKTGKSAQTPDYDTPKKIIRKYFFKMRSCRLYWKVLFSLSLTWNMKGVLCISNKLFLSWGLCTTLFLFPDWLPKYLQL